MCVCVFEAHTQISTIFLHASFPTHPVSRLDLGASGGMHAHSQRLNHGALVVRDVLRQFVGEVRWVHDARAKAAMAGSPGRVCGEVRGEWNEME